MKKLTVLGIVLCGLALAACGKGGDDDDDNFSINDSTGSGSETLRVTASITVVGDGTPDDLSAEATITVRDSGSVPASEAVVTLSWPDGQVDLVEDPPGTGIFVVDSADELPFALGYGLHIERGSDLVDDVVIAAPELHEITAPERFTNHFAQQPMDVEWTGANTADEFRVELDSNPDPHTTWQSGDPGTFRIEGTFFASAGSATYIEMVTVRRKKTLQLTGTLPASTLVLEIRQDRGDIAINPPAP